MFSMNFNVKEYGSLSLNISCPSNELSFRGMTREITPNDICLEVPITRIKITLSQFLNKDVTIGCENVIFEGTMSWYTIEGDYYYIGIGLSKCHRSAWRKFLTERSRVSLSAEMHHVSP
jgi:hypothetical protein